MHSAVRYSIFCGSLFRPGWISYFHHVVSHERRLRPEQRTVWSNKKLLGLGLEIGRCWVSHFAITPAKCRLGWVQRNPTKLGAGSTQPTKCKVAQDRSNSNFQNVVSYRRQISELKNNTSLPVCWTPPRCFVCIRIRSSIRFHEQKPLAWL